MQIFNATLADKTVIFSAMTKFYVQTGKGKGSYSTKHVSVGDFWEAYNVYARTPALSGEKKRLLMDSNEPVILRDIVH